MGALERVPFIIYLYTMCLFGLLTYIGQYTTIYV